MHIQLKELTEQVLVITGASSGIGLATALMAADRGARVVLIARSQDTLQHTVDQILADGGDALAFPADVADPRQLHNAANAAIAEFGRIDTWINNAGVSIYGRIEEISEADNRRLFETNFWGVVNGSLAALPHLRSQGGALINVGTDLDEDSAHLQGMYAASKHAVKAFTDILRAEIQLEQSPISVSLIQPAPVNSPYREHAKHAGSPHAQHARPQLDPRAVAEAILNAAVRPSNTIQINPAAKPDTTIQRLIPSLTDRFVARHSTRTHAAHWPSHREGILHRPGHSGRIHGI